MRLILLLMFLVSSIVFGSRHNWKIYIDQVLERHLSANNYPAEKGQRLFPDLTSALIALHSSALKVCISMDILTSGGEISTPSPCGKIISKLPDAGVFIPTTTAQSPSGKMWITCPAELWIELEVIKIDIAFTAKHCHQAGIILSHLLGEPHNVTYCGNRKPEMLYSYQYLLITVYTQLHQYSINLQYHFIDKPEFRLVLRIPNVPQLTKGCPASGCDIMLNIADFHPFKVHEVSKVNHLNFLFYSEFKILTRIHLKGFNFPYQIHEGPGELSPIANVPDYQVYTNNQIQFIFLVVYVPEEMGAKSDTIRYQYDRHYMRNRKYTHNSNGTINCYQNIYEVGTMNEKWSSLSIEVHSSANTNNWCHLALNSPYAIDMALSFSGFSHYIQHDSMPSCQSGGIVITVRDLKSPMTYFCHSLTVSHDMLYSSVNMYIHIVFYAGYSAGVAKFKFTTLNEYPAVINFDDFLPMENVRLYNSANWDIEEIQVANEEVVEQTKFTYILMYPNTLITPAPTNETYRFFVEAGKLNGNIKLGLITVNIDLTCSGSTHCETEVVLYSKTKDKVSENKNQFSGSVTWHDTISQAIYVTIEILMTDVDKIYLAINLEKMQECSYNTDGNYAMQIPYTKCKLFTIPYFLRTAKVTPQIFQSITVRVDPRCNIKKCLHLKAEVEPTIPLYPTLVWTDTKLEETHIDIHMPGEVTLAWSISDACEKNNDKNDKNKAINCDLQVTIHTLLNSFDSNFVITTTEDDYIVVRSSPNMEDIIFYNM